jgi:hypothetical protein
MTTTVLACPGIGMNYSNIAIICHNTVVLFSMVSGEGSKMASLHSCCIPAAAVTAPQHIVLPLAEPPLVAVCAANTNTAPSSSSSRLAWLENPFGIPRNSAINPFPDLLNSGIFIRILFFRSKMCSRQFWTRFLRFGILSCHWFFQIHELENIPAIIIFLARHENIQSYIS